MKKLFKKVGEFFTNIFYPKKIEAKKPKTKNALSEKNESSVSKELRKLKENSGRPVPNKSVKERYKEVSGLKSVKKTFTKKTKEELNEEMLRAVKAEKYELAAKLRDKIISLESSNS